MCIRDRCGTKAPALRPVSCLASSSVSTRGTAPACAVVKPVRGWGFPSLATSSWGTAVRSGLKALRVRAPASSSPCLSPDPIPSPACARGFHFPLAGLRQDDDLRGTQRRHKSTLRCSLAPARVVRRKISQPCAGPPGKKLAPRRAFAAGPAIRAAASLRKGRMATPA